MGKRAATDSLFVKEAARILCELRLTDYRLAKQKAAQRLNLGRDVPLPANADIHAAVIDYQRLFGGEAYSRHLRAMRRTALEVMRLLEDFSPQLVGAAVSGAVHDGHRVQLHCFCDTAEMVDIFVAERGIRAEPAERSYRFPDGRSDDIPLLRFSAGELGVDVAIFPDLGRRRTPLSPADGLPMRRLDADAVARLLDQDDDAGF